MFHCKFILQILLGGMHFFPTHDEMQHLLVLPQSASVWHESSQRAKRPRLEYVGHELGFNPEKIVQN